jgi:hypothetical protein
MIDEKCCAVIRCECCGTNGQQGRAVSVTFSRTTDCRAICEFCQGLIDAGLIREEWIDGERRFRQWHMGEWTPGELLPRPSMGDSPR